MTREKKEKRKIECIAGMYLYFNKIDYIYEHDYDCYELYDYMYKNYKLSWHKVQRLWFKEVPEKLRETMHDRSLLYF